MLISHISFSLGLIALVAGVCLYLWSVRAEAGSGIALAKIIGIVVIVLSIVDLIATVYSGMRIRNAYREVGHENCQLLAAPASTNANTAAQPAPVNNAPANNNNAPGVPGQ